MTVETFNSSTTWTCPAGVSSVLVEGWGKGGNGANGDGLLSGGGGGGGGAYATKTLSVTAGNSYAINVADYTYLGFVGSTFDGTSSGAGVFAPNGSNAVGGSGGAAGLASTHGLGSALHDGGSGGSNGGSSTGGGGAGSATSSANGNNGTPGNSGGAGGSGEGNGGNGGSGAGNGTNGAAPGAGAGGGGATGTGATGAAGRVKLTYTVVADDPLPRLTSQQLSYDLPDYDYRRYEQQRTQPLPLTLLPGPPLLNPQRSQHIEQLYDHGYRTYWQFCRTPVPIAGPMVGDRPATHQPSQQLSYLLPDYNYRWYEQFRIRPLPVGATAIHVNQQGTYGIYNTVTGVGQGGLFRIANDIAGYNLFVGTDALPDLTAAPVAFSLTLPFDYTVAVPGVGATTYYVLVQAQDHYGLVSQNQQYTTFTIDSSGNLVLPPIPAPQGLHAIAQANSTIRVLCVYPTARTDQYPATSWKVWIAASPPDPDIDPATVTVSVNGPGFLRDIATYAAGLWYVTIRLYRASDSAVSPYITTTVTMPDVPAKPSPVPSGDQQP